MHKNHQYMDGKSDKSHTYLRERRSTLYVGSSSSDYSQEEISRYSRIEDQRESIDYHPLGRRQPNSIETSRTHLVPISYPFRLPSRTLWCATRIHQG